MKLYANGCSFTHGHQFLRDVDTDPLQEYRGFKYQQGTAKHLFVWPTQLESKFDFVFNHAKEGSGMGRLLRTTISFIEHLKSINENLQEWVFVLQVSQVGRTEILDTYGEYDFPIRIAGDWGHKEGHILKVSHPNYDRTIFDYETADNILFNVISKEYGDSAYDWLMGYRSDVQMIVEHIKDLSLLIHYLDMHGLKYLITGMTGSGVDTEEMHSLCNYRPIVTPFFNLIIQDNIITTVEKLIGIRMNEPDWSKYYDPCGHPNKLGHKVWADYIYLNLQHRGYI